MDEGSLAAIAVDPRERVVRAVNGTLADALGVAVGDLEDEVVHAIVDEEHHGLVDAILDALAAGANLGPTRVALRPPAAEEATASVWARLPGVHELVGASVILLCQPYQTPTVQTGDAPARPQDHPGFGRIPPWPRRPWER